MAHRRVADEFGSDTGDGYAGRGGGYPGGRQEQEGSGVGGVGGTASGCWVGVVWGDGGCCEYISSVFCEAQVQAEEQGLGQAGL